MNMNDMNQISSKLQPISSKINNSFCNQDKKFTNFSPIIKEENKNSYNDLMTRRYNEVLSYYQTTVINLINSKEYNNFSSLILNSKNFIPKIKYFYEQSNNEQKYYFHHLNKVIYDMNNSKFNNLIFNNIEQNMTNNNFCQFNNCNYFLNNRLFLGKNIINYNYNCNKSFIENKDLEKSMAKESSEEKKTAILLDCPPFIPSNFNKKEEEDNEKLRASSKDSSLKDKESDSTSATSEKKEEENNDSLNKEKEKEKEKGKIKKNVQKYDKKEYIVEMFGRRGWICSLCNNFNYETRNKCNRCGIVKKPQKIIDLKQKYESKESKEIKDRNSKNNKDGDWICFNCRNLNYSFRNVCNRCKMPKVNQTISNNIQKNSTYSFPNSFFIIRNNNIPNFYLKNND